MLLTGGKKNISIGDTELYSLVPAQKKATQDKDETQNGDWEWMGASSQAVLSLKSCCIVSIPSFFKVGS